MRKLLTIIVVAFITQVQAQVITTPATTYIGVPVTLDLSSETFHASYTWSIDNTNIDPIFTGHTPVYGTGTVGQVFNVTSHAHMIFDPITEKYYAFVNSASASNSAPTLQRLNFGDNPNSTPTVTNFGNPLSTFISGSLTNLEGITSWKDELGIFHLFISNGGIVHLIFGEGIDQPPTVGNRIFDAPEMVMPMQLEILKQEKEHLLFVGNAFGTDKIMRIDLGTNLYAIPEAPNKVDLPGIYSTGFPHTPAYFSFFKEDNDWHMIISPCFLNSTHYRLSFGSDLKNNYPTVAQLDLYDVTTDSRGINFIRNNTDFYLAMLQLNSSFKKGNFSGDIISTPVYNPLGTNVLSTGSGFQMMEPYWYNDTLWALTTSWEAHAYSTVYRVPMTTLTGATAVITKYYDPEASFTFTEAGEHTITLFCDQGDQKGPMVYQKTITVLQGEAAISDSDFSQNISMFPNPAEDEIIIDLSATNIQGDLKIMIVDILGKTLQTIINTKFSINSNRMTIDVSSLTTGTYFIHLENQDARAVKKFVKK